MWTGVMSLQEPTKLLLKVLRAWIALHWQMLTDISFTRMVQNSEIWELWRDGHL